MTLDELGEVLAILRTSRSESTAVEAKRSEGQLPRRLWETLSAFANTPGGGIILLGVDEEQGFQVTGVRDAAQIQASLASMCDQMEPPLRPLIQVHRVNARLVVTAEVPEISYQLKPCYYRGAGITSGSFLRVGDRDRHLTQYEIHMFLEGRGQPLYDLQPVEGRAFEDLDAERISAFLRRLRDKPDAPYAGWDDNRLLHAFRVITSTEDRQGVPTLAGYLCFGTYPQEDFPGLHVSVVRYPGKTAGEIGPSGERTVDSVKVEGSIPHMLRSALAATTRNLRQRSLVMGLWRHDLLEYPVEVLREVLVNAMGHRDYSPLARGTPVQVRIFPDRLEVENPGGLFGPVTLERLGEPGLQASRNAYLMKLLEDAPSPEGQGTIAENRGTGIVSVLAALRRAAMEPPRFEDRRTTFLVSVSNASLLESDTLLWLEGLRDREITDNQRLALAYARKNGRITNAMYCHLTLVDSRVASQDLRDLVAHGLLEQEGARRWATYVLAPESGGSAPPSARPVRADRRSAIISLLSQRGPLSALEIATATGLSRPGAMRWLRTMRDEGLVETTAPTRSPSTRYKLREVSPGEAQ